MEIKWRMVKGIRGQGLLEYGLRCDKCGTTYFGLIETDRAVIELSVRDIPCLTGHAPEVDNA